MQIVLSGHAHNQEYITEKGEEYSTPLYGPVLQPFIGVVTFLYKVVSQASCPITSLTGHDPMKRPIVK